MATANEQIRVSNRVKRILDRRRREGESYNDVLERILNKDDEGDFYDGFGRWSEEQAERVRKQREQTTEKRKARMRRLAVEDSENARKFSMRTFSSTISKAMKRPKSSMRPTAASPSSG